MNVNVDSSSSDNRLGNPLTEALGHGLASALPVIGPAAAAIGEQIGGTEPRFDKYGNVLEPGQPPDIAGGVGRGAGLITGVMAGPAAVRGAARGVKWGAEPLVKTALRLPPG